MTTPTRFTLTESSAALWRVTFSNPPLNLIDSVMISELDALFSRIESSDTVAVVVFDSADPDFFLAHFDIVEIANGDAEAQPAGTPPRQPHPWLTSLARLNTLPAVTISSIRGRARGAGSEFVIATDLRFASREKSCAWPVRDWGQRDTRWWTRVTITCTGRTGTRVRDPLRWLRFRWRPGRTVWLRQPRLARRRTRRLRRRVRQPRFEISIPRPSGTSKDSSTWRRCGPTLNSQDRCTHSGPPSAGQQWATRSNSCLPQGFNSAATSSTTLVSGPASYQAPRRTSHLNGFRP
jgi:Enoyl-CoA hydratase/isomerase